MDELLRLSRTAKWHKSNVRFTKGRKRCCVRGRVFSYALSSPACAIPDSSPKLEDPRKRPILLVAHSNNSARLRTWSAVFWRVWSESAAGKTGSGNANLLIKIELSIMRNA